MMSVKEPSKQLAVFRVDSSLEIGSGHVSRCLALARVLVEKNFNVHFICRTHVGHMCDRIESHFSLSRLLPDDRIGQDFSDLSQYSAWLGATQSQDAAEVNGVLKKLNIKPDWMIVDHYAIDIEWEQAVGPCVRRILVIDDLFNRRHKCDILLNQSSLAGSDRYKFLVEKDTKLLIGARYAMLKPEYALLRSSKARTIGDLRRILVFLGGVDKQNVTEKVLKAINCINLSDVTVDVVIGAANPNREAVELLIRSLKNVALHIQVGDLESYISAADLAIGAGGVTTWERFCLGLPSLVISVAPNQVEFSEELGRAGYHVYLGNSDEINWKDIEANIIAFKNPALRKVFSQRSEEIVDGLGCLRIANILALKDRVAIRRANRLDSQLIMDWRNSDIARKNSMSDILISASEHQKWFDKKIVDEKCIMLIGEFNEEPCGVVRYELDERNESAEISIFLSPKKIGFGLGPALLEESQKWLNEQYPNVKKINASVKSNNKPSLSMFESVGYETKVRYLTKCFH